MLIVFVSGRWHWRASPPVSPLFTIWSSALFGLKALPTLHLLSDHFHLARDSRPSAYYVGIPRSRLLNISLFFQYCINFVDSVLPGVFCFSRNWLVFVLLWQVMLRYYFPCLFQALLASLVIVLSGSLLPVFYVVPCSSCNIVLLFKKTFWDMILFWSVFGGIRFCSGLVQNLKNFMSLLFKTILLNHNSKAMSDFSWLIFINVYDYVCPIFFSVTTVALSFRGTNNSVCEYFWNTVKIYILDSGTIISFEIIWL